MVIEQVLLVFFIAARSMNVSSCTIRHSELNMYLSSAVHALNSARLGDFKTSRYEYIGSVFDYSKKENAFYIDFSGDNGWLVLSSALQIRGFADKGDICEIRSSQKYIVYIDNKFGTLDDKKGFTFLDEFKKENGMADPKGGDLSVSKYPIEYGSILSYLQSKYDSTFTLGDNGRLASLSTAPTSSWYTQYPESVFHKWDNDAQAYESEGNCGPTAVSNALYYYSYFDGKSSLPSYSWTVSFSPYSNVSLLQAALVAGYSPKSAYVTIHELYSKVRDYTISQGYVCEISYSSWLQYAYQNTCAYYGYTGAMTSETATTSLGVENAIGSGKPIVVHMANDDAYGYHFAMGLSYRRYWTQKQLENNIYVYFDVFCIGIVDGHSSIERWYDVDRWCSYDMGDFRCDGVSIFSLSIGGNP